MGAVAVCLACLECGFVAWAVLQSGEEMQWVAARWTEVDDAVARPRKGTLTSAACSLADVAISWHWADLHPISLLPSLSAARHSIPEVVRPIL